LDSIGNAESFVNLSNTASSNLMAFHDDEGRDTLRVSHLSNPSLERILKVKTKEEINFLSNSNRMNE